MTTPSPPRRLLIAEDKAIRSRPKKRRYHRRMSDWTGVDEEANRQVLNRLMDNTAADLERLRRKYRVDPERPTFTPL
jgi:hypothetical protein